LIPYEVIHNQVLRKNIQKVLSNYSLELPNIITKQDIVMLSDLISNNREKNKRNKQLILILFLFYCSVDFSYIRRIYAVLVSGFFVKMFQNLPISLLARLFIPKNKNQFAVNNICNYESMHNYSHDISIKYEF
jgi:hypothetical protein